MQHEHLCLPQKPEAIGKVMDDRMAMVNVNTRQKLCAQQRVLQATRLCLHEAPAGAAEHAAEEPRPCTHRRTPPSPSPYASPDPVPDPRQTRPS